MTRRQRSHVSSVRCLLSCILLTAILSGCLATPQTTYLLQQNNTGLHPGKELAWVPFFPQRKYQCGPAALATALQAAGVEVTPDELVPKVYLPSRHGSLQLEMLAAAREYAVIPLIMEPSLEQLLQELQAERPVLVLQNLGLSWLPFWHYAVVVGYDLEQEQLILRSGTIERYRVPMQLFEHTWRRANYWGMLVLKPGQLPVAADERTYFTAAATFAAQNPPEAVEEVYRAGVDRWPGSNLMAMGLGNAYYSEGESQKAIEVYQAIIDRDDNYAPAHNNLAQILFELGQVDPALVHARQAMAIGGNHGEQYRATLESIEQLIQAKAKDRSQQ